MRNTILQAAITLLILSGGALSQEIGNSSDGADSVYIAADADTAAVAVEAPLAATQEPDNKPAIAVYVTGDSIPQTTKDALSDYLLTALVNGGADANEETSAAFLAAVGEEHSKGKRPLNDSLICELSRKFGIRYICAATITPAPDSVFTLSARVISVKTGTSRFNGEAAGPLNTMNEFEQTCGALVEKMFGGKRIFGGQTTQEATPDSITTAAQEPDDNPAIAADSTANVEPPIQQPILQTMWTKLSTQKKSFWIALSADVAGAGIFGVGIYKEMNVRDLIDKEKFTKSAKAETARNVCYVLGTVVLAAGISIHILF
jgi:hypothetical protein